MKKLIPLLAQIDSKLNLLLAMVSEYELKIPTLVTRVRQARLNLAKKNLNALFLDLEWITRTILSRKVLRQRFERQTLDLHILKEELKNHVGASGPKNVFEQSVQRWQLRLIRGFKALERDLWAILEATQTIYVEDLRNSVRNAIAVETDLKNQVWVPSHTNETIVIQTISLLTERTENLNNILLSVPHSERLQELRRKLLDSWNGFVEVMMNLFKEIYQEAKPVVNVRTSGSRQTIQHLEIQP